MTKQTIKKPVIIAMGAALTGGLLATGTTSAAANPFGLSELGSGYMQVAEGTCGGTQQKAEEGKCGGAQPKVEEGKCGGTQQKAEEGTCGGAKPAPKPAEGKCGEAKCGASK